MNATSMTLQMRQRGSLTLPKKLRTRYRLREGEVFTLVDLGGVFVLSPKVSLVARMAAEIEQMRDESDLTVGDLLEGLDETRKQLYAETYDTDS
jgi:bifunctional DNA-binding transcriptional regulator/antitoxin component of YhaV-PrlF toxin-antitoxin module